MLFLCAEFVLFWVRKLQIASLRLFVVYSRVLRAAVLEVFRFRRAHPCNSPQSKARHLLFRPDALCLRRVCAILR